jgi:uncharacterized protein
VRVVLDTNVLISGIFWSGPPAKILEHWVDGRFDLFASQPILDEYARIILEIAQEEDASLSSRWQFFITENSRIVEIKHHLKLCRDKDDNKFIECAVSASAQYMVSGDDDLLSLGIVFDTQILKPAEFLRIIATT